MSEEMCRLLTDEYGRQFVTMPDGTIIPWQQKTVIKQDTEQSVVGQATAIIILQIDTHPL